MQKKLKILKYSKLDLLINEKETFPTEDIKVYQVRGKKAGIPKSKKSHFKFKEEIVLLGQCFRMKK